MLGQPSGLASAFGLLSAISAFRDDLAAPRPTGAVHVGSSVSG